MKLWEKGVVELVATEIREWIRLFGAEIEGGGELEL